MSSFEPWEFRPGVDAGKPTQLIGYTVMATDGEVGEVDVATTEQEALVVDTGAWVVGQRVLLPAGTVQHIDHDDHRVTVDRSIPEIKGAPPYDPVQGEEAGYRSELADYYCGLYDDIAGG